MNQMETNHAENREIVAEFLRAMELETEYFSFDHFETLPDMSELQD